MESSKPLATSGGSARSASPASAVPTRSYPLDISISRNLKAELRFYGEDLKREDLEKLKKLLGRLLENIGDAFSD